MAPPQLRGASTSQLLRFATVGSVDDGKSTLIGRLLHDTKQLADDHIEALSSASRRRGLSGVDLSFVTDGLRAEREQGITIDVAYRYASTPQRKLIIADCPGHLQYTRNMATGASTADLVVVVVDVAAGVRDQTRRHLCIAALLGVRHLVVAVNKMDLVGWDRNAFEPVVAELERLAHRLGVESVVAVPVSALRGDNVVEKSGEAPWYEGPTVLDALHQAEAGLWAGGGGGSSGGGGGGSGGGGGQGSARLAVQIVSRRPGGGRAYAGMLSGSSLHPGDEVVVLPGGLRSVVVELSTLGGPVTEALPSESVSVVLQDDIDVSRGDVISATEGAPSPTNEIEAVVCWFGAEPLRARQRYHIKHTTRVVMAEVRAVESRLDVETLALDGAESLSDNEIGVVRFVVATELVIDAYRDNRVTGSFIIIDSNSNVTVGAAMVGPPAIVATNDETSDGSGALAPLGV